MAHLSDITSATNTVTTNAVALANWASTNLTAYINAGDNQAQIAMTNLQAAVNVAATNEAAAVAIANTNYVAANNIAMTNYVASDNISRTNANAQINNVNYGITPCISATVSGATFTMYPTNNTACYYIIGSGAVTIAAHSSWFSAPYLAQQIAISMVYSNVGGSTIYGSYVVTNSLPSPLSISTTYPNLFGLIKPPFATNFYLYVLSPLQSY
jgi:hypothetical protein